MKSVLTISYKLRAVEKSERSIKTDKAFDCQQYAIRQQKNDN